MIVIIRNNKGIKIERFNFRILSMILYVLINKIKGNEVYLLDEKDI